LNPPEHASVMRRLASHGIIPLAVLIVVVAIPQMSDFKRQAIAVVISMIGFALVALSGRRPESDAPLWKVVRSFAAIGTTLVMLMNLPIGSLLCKPLLLPHSPGNADAVFVLASGVSEQGEYSYSGLQRIMHGATLLRAGRAPLLFISTGDPTFERPIPEALWVASFTALLNLPPDAFEILTGGITTTRTESMKAAQLLLPRGIRRILLVTNGPHITRAKAVFEAAGFEVLPAPVQSEATIRNACDSDLGLFRYAMHEWLGIVLYRLRGDFLKK